MLLEQCALVDEMLLDEGNIIQRVHMQVLIIGQDEDDVGALSTGAKLAALAERNLAVTALGIDSKGREEGLKHQAQGKKL